MVGFWTWCIRNPAFALGLAAAGSGFTQAADWSIALAVTLVCALVCKASNVLRRKALARRRQAQALRELAEMRRRVPVDRRRGPRLQNRDAA